MAVEIGGARAVLTDIEGTAGSIAFVKDVLFPYARTHLPQFIEAHRNDPTIARWLDATAREAGIDDPNSHRVIATLLRWLDEDRKATPLKALQGMVWKAGYESGAYRAHVYPEVPAKLRAWKTQGLRICVYSSGSVQAQQLLFAHTESGDLTPLFDGWFDTGIGSKRERGSYLRIAESMGIAPPAIVFLSDLTPELDAARGAGMRAVHVCRPPTSCAGTDPHPCITDFDALTLT